MDLTSSQLKAVNNKVDSKYKNLILKQYHCCKCKNYENDLVKMKTILGTVTKLKEIFISQKTERTIYFYFFKEAR